MCTRLTRIAILFVALLAAPLHADDTEIYLGADLEQEVRPNVLFIIDTSGSMVDDREDANHMIWVEGDYDAGTTYAGTCDPNKLYWSDGTLPSCSSKNWFVNDKAHNTCQDSWDNLEKDGEYSGKFYMLDPKKLSWGAPGSSGQNWKIECSADYPDPGNGIAGHGETAGDGRPYPTFYAPTGWSATYSKKYTRRPNSPITLFSGNYVNFRKAGGSVGAWWTRLAVVKKVLKELLDNNSGINVGIMAFNNKSVSSKDGDKSNDGGYMVSPMLELNDANRVTLKDLIDGLKGESMTPVAETLYEATRYYQGLAPKYGTTTYGPGSNAATISGGKYISPIKYQCQKNFIVLFSDGDPTYDDGADSAIGSQTDFSKLAPSCSFKYSGGNKLYPTADCGVSQATYLYEQDLVGNAFNDRQNVSTYTIGLETGMSDFGKAFMPAMASAGHGEYYATSDANSVKDAFRKIMNDIRSVNDTFTAPAVTVNAFNRLTYLDELYYAVFRPEITPKWDGNIKRYRLGIPAAGSPLAILDAKGLPAIDDASGYFKKTATSFWSTDVDGENVSKGGAAIHMPAPDDRNAFTCCFGSTDLTAAANKFHEDNANITSTILGANNADERKTILQWARGVDLHDVDGDIETSDARLQLSDPLHTEPLLVTYGKSGATVDMTLFVATNEGFLHAIDTRTGEEQFAFIPADLLDNLRALAVNDSAADHPYGLDGPLTAWVYDKDYDSKIEAPTDHVYLYATMRRGGRNVYALDVTNRAKPTIMWTITGGTGVFSELAYTFSKPTYSKVKLNGTVRDVLFFGGGYDVNQDGNDVPADDSVGRAIYMVDALTGTLLWRAGPDPAAHLKLTAMTNSIPSDVRVIDLEGDGLADRLYVGDMRGRLWRVDINNTNTGAASLATGGVIATVSVEATSYGNRRFYYPPSVSLSSKGNYLNIAIGSGYREHPLNKVIRDRFYVIRDKFVRGPEISGGAPTYTLLSNFVDATDWLAEEDVNTTALDASDGFYIDLIGTTGWEGEKVLAQALTMNGAVIFTTFTPVTGVSETACAPSQGTAREYIMSVHNGTALRETGRVNPLTHGGIPPRPVPITTEDGSAIVIGTNLDNGAGANEKLTKSTWMRK